MNKFIGIGRNTKDGELRHNSQDIAMYSNSLAMTNNFKNKDGNYDSEFINYIAFRQTAEYLSKYSKKGTQIAIEGRITTRSYEKDNEKKYITEIVVEKASILDSKKEQKQEVEILQNTKSEYDDENSDIKLTDEDIDKTFNNSLELPF